MEKLDHAEIGPNKIMATALHDRLPKQTLHVQVIVGLGPNRMATASHDQPPRHALLRGDDKIKQRQSIEFTSQLLCTAGKNTTPSH